MKTIKSSSTFIEQNPLNSSCNVVTYMDRNHMQTFNNLTTQPRMQIPYNTYNLGKWDKLTNTCFDKGTIKTKCYNLLRCLHFFCLTPSIEMLPQKWLLHKCINSCLDWKHYKMYVHGYDGEPMACNCKYFKKHNFTLFHETPTSWKIIEEKDFHHLSRHASC
jgi:hypothetical protein